MRRIKVVCLVPSDEVIEFTRIVPALPAFEEPFAAFTRSTLIQSDRGLIAVEDLWPGDRIKTLHNGMQTLLWKGMTTLVPQAEGQDPCMGRLTRIAADGLGIARPMSDLVLGPRARLVYRAPALLALINDTAALIPARDMIDGISVVELTPPQPVDVFHLAFAHQQILTANGVEVESYHPGPLPLLGLGDEMLALFRACFPHLATGQDFGRAALPRLSITDLDYTPAILA